MSRAAVSQLSDAAKSESQRKSASVRVSHPDDSFEVEADRVANTVSRGGRVSGWSLSASKFDGIYRQAAPAPAPSVGEIAGKVGEALLATPAGKKALDAVTSAVKTPAGLAVTGATAIGVITAMDKAKKPLPAQAPAIPLDFIKPGLSVKITWSGPVNQPTDGSIRFSYTPKAADQKPAQPFAGNAAMAAEQEKFRASLHTPTGLGHAPVKAPEQQKKPEPAATPKAEEKKKEEIPVHRKAEPSSSRSTGSADVDFVLRSSGQPLDHATRRDMESRIGYDFSGVRLHTDSRAAESAQSLSAQAYTVGSNVVFAAGRFAPQTSEGRRLLAHELTHVVQQTTSPQRAHPVVRPTSSHVQRAWSGMDLPGASWLIGKVRGITGYKLVCTVVGHDLFDDSQAYVRNAETITQGILELVPRGQEIYEKLKSAGKAIEKAYHWLAEEFTRRNLTEAGIYDVLDRAVHAFSGWHPVDSGEQVMKIVSEPINQLIDLAGVIGRKVLDLVLEGAIATFGETGQRVWAFFQHAEGVISTIAANPLQFLNNLLKAVGEGFSNFFLKIWDYLSKGVKEWIYSELDLPKDIKMPEDFTLGSMMKLLLQVLGLTWEHRRPQLVEKLQPIGGETVVHFFETLADKAGDFIKRIKEQGFAAIKEMIVEQAGDIFNTVVSGIKDWVGKKLLEEGVKLIAKLSNPAGGLIAIAESIINTVTFIIDKAKKLVELINTVVNALADIAAGNTGPAAKKVEDTLANSIPLLLHFLAVQLNVDGIGKAIREIIHKIRKPLDDLIGKVLDVVVTKIQPLWEKGKAAFLAKLESVKNWWTKPKQFRVGEEKHTVSIEGEGDKPQVFVESNKTPLEHFLKDVKATPQQTRTILNLASKLGWKRGALQTPEEDEKGAKIYEKLIMELDHLKARQAKPSFLADQKTDPDLGGGLVADAHVTTNHPVGTEPRGKDPPGWEDLGYLLAKKHYVRGHLLSMRLGGPGEWQNMMPLTNAVNSRMNSRVEAPLKKSVANTDRAYHYIVRADYDKTPLPDPDPKDTPNTNKKRRADAAEKRLKKISWTVGMMKLDEASGKLVDDPKADLIDGEGNPMPKTVAADSITPWDT